MKKVILLITIILLIGNLSSVAKTSTYNFTSEKINSLNIDDDVPIWNIGNYWTYDIDTLILDLYQTGQIISLNLTWEDLKLEVKTKTIESYTIDVTGKITGSFLYDNGAGIRLAGKLYYNKFSGNIQIRQSDIALEKGDFKLKSIALLKEHPFPIPIPIPVPITITFNITNNMPRPFIDFPLYNGKMGFINETLVSSKILVESIVLKILNIITSSVPSEINYEYQMNIPELLYNASVENITVKAGTFNAYNIVFYEGLLGSVYYAPLAGNIIKAHAEFTIEDLLNFKFHGELKNYNYS
ncbi:MAG: hypothetical protein QHH15_05170 [Candidatus Thermoplasmatota archaeon]|jgi:hypothetical protein|nr:hypothetical protein [Candidatus Thermoplasmatota archaeon]